MEVPEGGGDRPAALPEISVKRSVAGRGRGKARPIDSPGAPSSLTPPSVLSPPLPASPPRAFATASSPPAGRGRARCALLRALERDARPPPQPCDLQKQESAVPTPEAASTMDATKEANSACAMPGQWPDATGNTAVYLTGSSTGHVEGDQSRRQEEVCPSPEGDEQQHGDQPQRDLVGDTTKDDDKNTLSSPPSLDPDDPSHQRGQARETTTDEDKSTMSSQPGFVPDDPSLQRDEDQLLDLPQCETIARKATSMPDSLTSEELEELARAICEKAAEDTKNAWPAANLCRSIITVRRATLERALTSQKEQEPEPEPKFIDCLLSSCEEWFEHRAERLPRTTRYGSVWWKKKQREATKGSAGTFAGRSWNWTAYVAFVAELLVAAIGARRSSSADSPPFSMTRERSYRLAMLLCDCCQEILRFPGPDIQEEMECLRSALTLAGKVADQVAPDRMEILLLWLRAACFDHQFPPDARDIARELVNLRFLGWKEP